MDLTSLWTCVGRRDDHATLKRFFQETNQVRLQPANSEMAPIVIPCTEWDKEWQIQEKVVAIFRPALHQLFTHTG